MSLNIYSLAFDAGGSLPGRFTADGEDLSPPLSWLEPPEQTRSFAIVCVDPDAPRGPFYHWALFDIPAEVRTLPEGIAPVDPIKGMRQAQNDFGRTGYGGPTPPPSHGPHRYEFVVFALSERHLDVSAYPKARDVHRLASEHALEQVTLLATYGRGFRR